MTDPSHTDKATEGEMRLNTETVEREGNLFTVPMTQYLMPHGRTKAVQSCDLRGADLADKAQSILDAGLRFECEVLSDYLTISFTVFDPEEEDDIAGPFLVANGPAVPETIENMIRSFSAPLSPDRGE
jgi:hypothetical protein